MNNLWKRNELKIDISNWKLELEKDVRQEFLEPTQLAFTIEELHWGKRYKFRLYPLGNINLNRAHWSIKPRDLQIWIRYFKCLSLFTHLYVHFTVKYKLLWTKSL